VVIFLPFRKDLFVQRSLSVLMPVKDAQSTLAASVHEILDLVEDSIDRFELLIIDDGSTDATSEVAHELTCHYPQVRVVRHGTSRGREAALRAGLNRSRGEVVVTRDDSGGFRVLERRPSGVHTPSRPTRPNYLSRLRSFVLSE
jgi:glycosyltransferase involved in cell wall biosynthesis